MWRLITTFPLDAGECDMRALLASYSVSETVQCKETNTADETSMKFSSLTHGSKIVLSEDGLQARKRGPYYREGTGVYIATPLRGACEIELEVTDSDSRSRNHGSLVIGIGQSPKGSYKHVDLPHKTGQRLIVIQQYLLALVLGSGRKLAV